MHRPDDRFSAVEQLRLIIKRYPQDPIDIEGAVIDFIGQSGCSLDQVFDLNATVYLDLFTGGHAHRGARILTSIMASEEMKKELTQRCRGRYDEVARILSEQGTSDRASAEAMSSFLLDPSGYLGYPVMCVIWQLSDLHFGPLNSLMKSPSELAFMLSKLRHDYRTLQPNIILISGDVSSSGREEEYSAFVTFCRTLSTALWEADHPERILVVPGNHDVRWQSDGTADRGTGFASVIASSNCCITPFGTQEAEFDAGAVKVRWRSGHNDHTPPFSIVEYRKQDLSFLLLVSNFFSGIVPEQVRNLLDSAHSSDALMELLRVDKGEVSEEFLFELAREEFPSHGTPIALVHHNPIPIGFEVCVNKYAQQMLETLSSKGVPLVLHGHAHQVEDRRSHRPAINGQCYAVPCSTLSSVPAAGSARGINVICVGPNEPKRTVDVMQWSLSASLNFKPEGLVHRYRVTVANGDSDVEHDLQL